MEEIGPYRIVRWLGRGGMGTVFEALDTVLGRRVALKLIAEEYADDPAFRARFVREARAQAALDSPHVVQVFAHGEVDGRLFIASQLVPDGDLGAELRRHGPLPAPVAVELVAQVADGLAEAHRVGLVHRDIKPSNVLLRRRGTHTVAYIADFGIAGPVGAPGVEGDLAALERLLRTCLGGYAAPAGVDLSSAAALRDSLRTGPSPVRRSRSAAAPTLLLAAALVVAMVAAVVAAVVALATPAGVPTARPDPPDAASRRAAARVLERDAGLDAVGARCTARALARRHGLGALRDGAEADPALVADAFASAFACLWPGPTVPVAEPLPVGR